jgi:ATP phosphoribosyltransferase regulatory subunit
VLCGQVVIKGDGLDPARERLQLGAELIGSDSVAAAGEIVMLAIEALKAAGRPASRSISRCPIWSIRWPPRALPLAPEQDRGGAPRTRCQGCRRAEGEAGGEAYLPLLYATGPFDSAIGGCASSTRAARWPPHRRACADCRARWAGQGALTLDPSERHGFEYQSWFGFTLYAEGLRGALGGAAPTASCGQRRAGDRFLALSRSADRMLAEGERGARRLFLPLGHDVEVAARLRAVGWRTVWPTSP